MGNLRPRPEPPPPVQVGTARNEMRLFSALPEGAEGPTHFRPRDVQIK